MGEFAAQRIVLSSFRNLYSLNLLIGLQNRQKVDIESMIRQIRRALSYILGSVVYFQAVTTCGQEIRTKCFVRWEKKKTMFLYFWEQPSPHFVYNRSSYDPSGPMLLGCRQMQQLYIILAWAEIKQNYLEYGIYWINNPVMATTLGYKFKMR